MFYENPGIVALFIVLVLWLSYKSNTYLFMGMVWVILLWKNYEKEACVLLGLIFVVMLWSEWNGNDSVLKWLLVKNKKDKRR